MGRQGCRTRERLAISAVCMLALAAAVVHGPVGLSPAGAAAPTPAARSAAVAAASGKAVLVFGGFGGGFALGQTTLDDTWVWNGLGWVQRETPTAPPSRQGAAAAYFPTTRSIVVFGGDTGCCTRLGDTWTWSIDDKVWTRHLPATSPTPRSAATMAFDAATGSLVLFGGFGPPTNTLGDSPVRLDDTWTWDGERWTPRAPAVRPPARSKAAMASLGGQVFLFGGESGVPDNAALGDTWAWNGASGTWEERTPVTGPSPRHGAVMAYHPPTSQLLLFGGAAGASNTELDDTWVWNGTRWKPKFPVNRPSPRMRVAMAHHAPTATTMLFGGEVDGTTLGDTWAWNGTNWKRR